jgi:PTS system nitrogen regulatory IIA component
MNISDFLSPDDTLVGIRATEKIGLLNDLCARAAATLKVDAERISSEILKREHLGSTGVGGGVAIPHARIQDVSKPFGVFVRLIKAIDFDAIDGQPVDIVFLLLLPAARKEEQLNILASVARKLRNPTTMESIRRASDSAAMYRAITAD